MNYTLNQLIVFHKVVKTKSITKTAQELFMTQPAASIQLKNFQNQFDIPLTELRGRKIHITDFGLEIATITEQVLDQLNSLDYKTKEHRDIVSGRLKISSASTGKYVIPYFLSGFLEKFPGIDLILDVTNKSKVIDALKNKEIEFALVSVLPDNLDVEEVLLLENKLFLVNNRNTLVNKKAYIYREPGSATRAEMEKYFQKKKAIGSGQLELTSNEAVKQAVLAGLGSSILPLIGIRNELTNKSLNIIEKKDLPIITYWRLIWLKNRPLSPAGEAYIKYIKTHRDEIIKKHFSWYLEY
jgi:DNA-binding transcriptional LysR family regulator